MFNSIPPTSYASNPGCRDKLRPTHGTNFVEALTLPRLVTVSDLNEGSIIDIDFHFLHRRGLENIKSHNKSIGEVAEWLWR